MHRKESRIVNSLKNALYSEEVQGLWKGHLTIFWQI